MAKTLTFIVTHMEPAVPSKFFDHAIALGQYGEEMPTHISRLNPFWHVARPVAYQVAGSYAIPQAVQDLGATSEIIGVISQRKIVSRLEIGKPAGNAPHMRQVTSAELIDLDIEQTQPALGRRFLVSQMQYFHEGIISQYASCHNVIDLFEYLSIALKVGLLTSADINAFAKQRRLISGGCEMGFYPASWLLPTLEKMEEVGRIFIEQNRERISTYDSYQVRAMGFLSERLGSYLLLKVLTDTYGSKIDEAVFGTICNVADVGEYTHGITESETDKAEDELNDKFAKFVHLDKIYEDLNKVPRGPNLCLGKAAMQSSVGQWSNHDDPAEEAKGAVDGKLTGFYGFHTDLEPQPWWSVDLGDLVCVREVRIFNFISEQGIAGRASKFFLEASLDGLEWQAFYHRSDATPFGGYDGNPFVWRKQQGVATRHIRVRLTTTNWLHLDQVEVYGDILPSK